MRVGYDIDGVLYDVVDATRLHIHRETNRPLDTMPDADTWSFWKDRWGLTQEEFMWYLADGINKGFIFRHGSPLPGSVASVQKLYRLGHEIHLVSSRGIPGAEDAALANTRIWLARNAIPHDSLTITDDKTEVEVDIFLDDNEANYDPLDAAGHYPWLFTRPWNARHPGRRVVTHNQFVEVVTWRESQLNKGRAKVR